MARPKKGTPEYELWLCAIEVATYPPIEHGNQATGQVSWQPLDNLRAALDGVGIDRREATAKDRANRNLSP